MFDVVIVGGGPAGLSAALVLGRCRRTVLLCDSGKPRNARSRALHGYLTRDGIAPLELLRIGREELRTYGITPVATEITRVDRTPEGFEIVLADGKRVRSHTVLIATGVRDMLPPIPGIEQCYGISVHHCPYCDGWEVQDKALAVIGSGTSAVGLALSLKTWSPQVMVCTIGRSNVTGAQRAQLEREGIQTVRWRIAHIDHDAGMMRQIVFANGEARTCDAAFFTSPQRPQSEIAARLGCEFTRKGVVKTDHLGQTCVPGVYVVGDASFDVQFAIVAAAEGAKAAVSINKSLQTRAGLAVTSAA